MSGRVPVEDQIAAVYFEGGDRGFWKLGAAYGEKGKVVEESGPCEMRVEMVGLTCDELNCGSEG